MATVLCGGLWQWSVAIAPLLSLYVEAAELWMKKLRFYKRPTPPVSPWSRAQFVKWVIGYGTGFLYRRQVQFLQTVFEIFIVGG